MTEKFKSYPFRTLSAFLLMAAGIAMNIEAWHDRMDGDRDTIIGITVFFIGVIVCLKIYGETWFKKV